MRGWSVVILIAATAVCVSCQSVRQAANVIGELQQVQQAASKAVGSEVNVNLNNGNSLVIGIVNSPLKALPTEQKKAKALEVAQLAYRSYPQAAKLDQVSVVFVTQKSYVGVVNYKDTSDAFNFTAPDLSNPKSSDGESSVH
jgi:hypothetical protein